MLNILSRLLWGESGATAIEYSLIAAFIALMIIGGASQIGTTILPWFQAVVDGLD